MIASQISRSVVDCELEFDHVDCRSTRRNFLSKGAYDNQPQTQSTYGVDAPPGLEPALSL